jgi:hypothetical protein
MDIQLEANQAGLIGDIVPSSRGASGKKHFVTPKFSSRGLTDLQTRRKARANGGKGPVLPNPDHLYATDVTLKASDSANFAANYKWVNATPDPRFPHVAKVPRHTAKHYQVQIQRRSNNAVVAELNVWVIGADISLKDRKPRGNGDDGESFTIALGYTFNYVIKPTNLVTGDYPDLKGRNSKPVPPKGGLHYDGTALTNGADTKWDCSRIVRLKVINPSGVRLSGGHTPEMNKTYDQYPSIDDGDGRPGGAEAISFEDWLAVGNDDNNLFDEENDPYAEGMLGQLKSWDSPRVGMLHADGKDGDTVEWRLHFQEFVRLEINGKWYVVSDHFPWRVHYLLKRVGGRWQDNGSAPKPDNDGF